MNNNTRFTEKIRRQKWNKQYNIGGFLSVPSPQFRFGTQSEIPLFGSVLFSIPYLPFFHVQSSDQVSSDRPSTSLPLVTNTNKKIKQNIIYNIYYSIPGIWNNRKSRLGILTIMLPIIYNATNNCTNTPLFLTKRERKGNKEPLFSFRMQF